MSEEIESVGGDAFHSDGGGVTSGPAAHHPRILLDLDTGILTRDDVPTRLRPKTLAVLAALSARPGAVVGHDTLRDLVWGRRFGNEAGPKQCIRELRRVLGDTASKPIYIETVGRQGYRLRVPIEITSSNPEAPPLCVGRDAELSMIAASLRTAERGTRTVMFVSGEAGAGKTRLVDTFVSTLPNGRVWSARGQCVPHAGAREPYGPLLDVVRQLATGPSGAHVIRLIKQAAPSWLAQLPGRTRTRHAADDPTGAGIKPDSMVRELCDLLDLLAQRSAGVIVLEDLHWADDSTLAWLAAWGLRRDPARILVLATHRADEIDGASELAMVLRELGRSPGFRLLALGGLDTTAVSELLGRRFHGHLFPEALASALVQRTEGHAILVDGTIDEWVARGDVTHVDGCWVLGRAVPALVADIAPDIRRHITDRIDALGADDRRLLEGASVAGSDFSPAALAGSRAEREDIEYRLEQLARRQHIIERRDIERWPDGTITMLYAFRHALYREALYDGIPPANLAGLHLRIGERLEAGYGTRAAEIAPVLAEHFEHGGDAGRAALYRTLAATDALGRGAATDAATQFRRALELCRQVDNEDRRLIERDALLGLGAALIMSEGFTAAELPALYEQARALFTDPGEAAHAVIPLLSGQWNYHLSRAEIAVAARIADALGRASPGAPIAWQMAAHNAAGLTKWFGGAPAECLPHIDAVLGMAGTAGAGDAAAILGEDPIIVCRQYAACVHQILGNANEAYRHVEAGIAWARTLDQPFGMAQMLWAGAVVAHQEGDVTLVFERARALVDLCQQASIAFWLPAGQVMAGWARVMRGDREGLAELHDGCDAFVRMEVRLTLPFNLALLAEASARCGDTRTGFRALLRALGTVRVTGERWYVAELHRGWGELSLVEGRPASARRAFERALELARRQEIPSFAARAEARLIQFRD